MLQDLEQLLFEMSAFGKEYGRMIGGGDINASTREKVLTGRVKAWTSEAEMAKLKRVRQKVDKVESPTFEGMKESEVRTLVDGIASIDAKEPGCPPVIEIVKDKLIYNSVVLNLRACSVHRVTRSAIQSFAIFLFSLFFLCFSVSLFLMLSSHCVHMIVLYIHPYIHRVGSARAERW